MNLLPKALLIAIVIIVVLVAVKFLSSGASQHVTAAQAISNVTSYIKVSNPSALVNVTNVSASQYSGSWHIVASVIINGTKACPTYYVYSFDYPQYQLVSRLENNYTANCIVNGVQSGKAYIIASYPIAIAWAYANIPAARNFVESYGYSNVNVSASYFNSVALGGQNFTRLWLVQYTAPTANTLTVGLSQLNGTLLYTKST